VVIQSILIGGEQAAEQLRQGAPGIIERIIRSSNKAMFEVQQHIQRDKLSGQVLHQRSGKMIASIRVIMAVFDGEKITAGVQGAGGPAWYGRLHEETGTKPHDIFPVRAKALAFYVGGKLVFAKRVHHPGFPPRPFMAPGWDEMRANTQARIQEGLNGIL
jgi:hypothetical protein